jgi:predicted DNA-binding transcriptional regulator YafY
MNNKRTVRIIRLLNMLQSGEGHNCSSLAKACGVKRRTILRDFRTLHEAGVPVEYDRKEQRYRIGGAAYLPPTDFTAEEALALMALAADFGRNDRLPLYKAAYSAALKLEAGLPATLRREVRETTRAITVRLDQVGDLGEKTSVHEQLVRTIEKRHAVEIEYESFTEWERIKTKLRPYQLLFSRRSWYVIGQSSLHDEIRIFNLVRIASLKELRERFSVPRSFNLDSYLGNAWHLMKSDGRDSHVVIRFKPLVAGNVAEVIWHKTQRTTQLSDGSLEFRATVSGLNEIAWWILGYGDQAEVLQPVKLRRLVAQRAQNMAAMYNGKS